MLGRAGDLQRAGLMEDERLTGLPLERLDLAHRPLGQRGHQIRAARLRRQPRRPRRRLRAERVLVDQRNLSAAAGQMEGNARAQRP